jgi:hypothetical protein
MSKIQDLANLIDQGNGTLARLQYILNIDENFDEYVDNSFDDYVNKIDGLLSTPSAVYSINTKKEIDYDTYDQLKESYKESLKPEIKPLEVEYADFLKRLSDFATTIDYQGCGIKVTPVAKLDYYSLQCSGSCEKDGPTFYIFTKDAHSEFIPFCLEFKYEWERTEGSIFNRITIYISTFIKKSWLASGKEYMADENFESINSFINAIKKEVFEIK